MRVDEEGQSCVLDATQLSDDELIVRLKRCVAQDRQLTARLLEHFGEVDARRLYRGIWAASYPVPAGCGGPATTDNLRVRCAAHNLLAAEHFYGRDRVLHKIAASRARVSVSKNDASRGPERAAVDVGSPRLETTRPLQADTRSLRESDSADRRTRIARSSA